MSRIGIFRGTFGPIHEGHISFALKAINKSGLDEVYFVAEEDPGHKPKVEEHNYRVKRINISIRNYPHLHFLKLENPNNYISELLPQIRKRFDGAQLVFLMGSDIAKSLPLWKDLDSLFLGNEILVGLRSKDQEPEIKSIFESLPIKPLKYTIINVPKPTVSSSTIRNQHGKLV